MKKYGSIILISIIIFVISFIFFSCRLDTIIQESYFGSDEVLQAPDLDIDEEELRSIEKVNGNLKKTFDPEPGIVPEEGIRDPFEPFYLNDSEEKKNTLILENIYVIGQTEYAELVFNQYKYNLAEGDIFQEVYLVQAINAGSLVLLKGDEVLTLYLNEMILD